MTGDFCVLCKFYIFLKEDHFAHTFSVKQSVENSEAEKVAQKMSITDLLFNSKKTREIKRGQK